MWCCFMVVVFFFFKQKTAYEIRPRDWSSDVCSSDLVNKNTGKLVWEVNNVGDKILHGQWSSAAVGKIGDVVQVVIGEGEGWVRGYEAMTGKKLWEFALNPKDSVWPKT